MILKSKFLIGDELLKLQPSENKILLFPKLESGEIGEVKSFQTYYQIIKEVHLNQTQKLIIGHLSYSENFKWTVKITQNRGKSLSTMGYSTDNYNLLLLEEALYLMESGMMQVFSGEIPLTIEQMYNVIGEVYSNAVDRYLIFKSLSSAGYILRLHDCQRLKQITKDYREPPNEQFLIDCSDIPKWSSKLDSDLSEDVSSRLNFFKNQKVPHLPVLCRVLFDVFSDGKSFSKSKEICPDYFLHHLVDCNTIVGENFQCNSFIPVLAGVVDDGDVSFLQLSKLKINDIKLIR